MKPTDSTTLIDDSVSDVGPSGDGRASEALSEDAAGQRDRKAEHIQLALREHMQLGARYFDHYAFEHRALPELDMAAVDLSTSFLSQQLNAPLLVSCMTGGTPEAAAINRNLAIAAEEVGVAIGVGSQRKAIEDPSASARSTFQVRHLAPSVPLLANLGAVQLNYGYDVAQCREAVEMIGADALVLHLNPLQEAIQPEGDTNFSHLLAKIAKVVEELEVPVIVKEIGMGMSPTVARQLFDAGVRVIDTAGLGGTSWARIEAARADDAALGELFADWGVPTPDSIAAVSALPDTITIGSGGVRNGLDVGKAIAMGADIVGLARPFLQGATESAATVVASMRRTLHELRICMFCVGAADLESLAGTPLVRRRI